MALTENNTYSGSISHNLRNQKTISNIDSIKQDSISKYSKSLYHGANIFSAEETKIGIFKKRYRYGFLNPYQNLTTGREYLFFTKPDLNIFPNKDGNGLSAGLNTPFWNDLRNRYPEVLYMLQSSVTTGGYNRDPFNQLLGNTVQSNLEMPSASADMIDTPANTYGVSIKYRGSSEASDDNHTFSLEFKDTKYLPVYNFFKAYDLYETAKHHGVVAPDHYYIINKILHDQYSIYKFIVDEDGETIVYYAKYYGVKSVNVPRDVFNSTTYDNGISYSIDFDAAFVEDMNPQILTDFNKLSLNFWNSKQYIIDPYDLDLDRADMRPAEAAIVTKQTPSSHIIFGTNQAIPTYNGQHSPMKNVPGGAGKYVYKLKWKGDSEV